VPRRILRRLAGLTAASAAALALAAIAAVPAGAATLPLGGEAAAFTLSLTPFFFNAPPPGARDHRR